MPAEAPSHDGGPAKADHANLLHRSTRGDEAAFAEWYDDTAARAYGLAVRVLRDRAQAQEVTQEAYLDCWRNSSRFDETRGSALSWFLTIVHRKSVDRVRAAEAARKRDATYIQRGQTIDHDSTAETVTASLDASRVRSALSLLTLKQRQAIELAFLGGYTHTEVATILDLPVGTAKSRIRDGLIRLRGALGVAEVDRATATSTP